MDMKGGDRLHSMNPILIIVKFDMIVYFIWVSFFDVFIFGPKPQSYLISKQSTQVTADSIKFPY